MPISTWSGGCHCGAVRFEVEAPEPLDVVECNCSICRKSGFLHLIVPGQRFHLLGGQDALRTYTFNTGTARHLYCGICGIKSFYVPRPNPDGYSVDVRCLDRVEVDDLKIVPFDGRDWEANITDLR